MRDHDEIWKKRKGYLKDPEKPHGYCVGCMGLMVEKLDPDDEGNSWEYWAEVGDRAGI